MERRRAAPPPPSASQVAERVRPALAALGIAVSDAHAERLARYLALLLPWNERVNLTAARSADEVLSRHLADTWALLPHLPPGAFRFLDVGAGAGFLGVGVAMFRPEAHCVLLEPVGKKHAFLRAAAREVPLPNLRALAQRLETYQATPDFAPFDVAASRATWPPSEWLERARPLLRPGGLAVAYEGREPATLPAGARRIRYRVGERAGTLALLEV